MLSSLYLVAALALGAVAQSNVSRQSGSLTVKTQQGNVQGFQSSSGVRAFLGIPYAAAGRWEAPQLPPTRNSTFQANKFGDGCLQVLNEFVVAGEHLLGLSDAQINIPSSENCLSVNVWAPSANRKQKTAVIIFIHGGAYQFGSSNDPYFTGGNFVQNNDDITFVTFNYRLNIFGQPNAPQLFSSTQSQNFGFLDMEAGIKWVHDNIAAFGGDPERITLIGQSSTGGSVESYTFNHPNSTFVKGVVRISGVDFVTPYSGGKVDPTGWNTVAKAVNCGDTVDDAQFQCMKNVPSDKMSAAYLAAGLTMFPLADGITLFADQAARGAAGNFLKVPFLVGSTQNELDAGTIPEQLILLNGRTIPSIANILSDLQTILQYTCTASASALYHLQAGAPTWRYHFQGIFRDLSPRADVRSYHLADIPSWFGTYTFTSDKTHTAIEKAFSAYNQGALAAFARDPQNGLANYGWPKYDPTKNNTVVQLGGWNNYTGAFPGDAFSLDSPCSSADAINQAVNLLNPLLIPSS